MILEASLYQDIMVENYENIFIQHVMKTKWQSFNLSRFFAESSNCDAKNNDLLMCGKSHVEISLWVFIIQLMLLFAIIEQTLSAVCCHENK